MGQSAQTQDMFSVPSGGIADFYMSDEDIAAVEREEAQKTFGDEGVAAFENVAKKMASYGRFGDDRIVHVESGEIVVPRALIEQSPELKESIFSHLREQGVEDPERYVVGSSANSLNPETGLPEFFLSKIAKGVKRAFKGVGKILKKVAPVVLPIALSMTPLGPVYGAAVGSGIGTLMQGGSLEDAMKSAVIAGGTGAVFKGFTGQGSFGENVSAAFADPGARFSQLGQGLTGQAPLFQSYTPASTPELNVDTSSLEGVTTASGTGTGVQTTTDPSFLDRAGDYMFRGGQSMQDVAAAQSLAETQAINQTLSKYGATSMAEAPLAVQNAAIAAGEAASKAAAPGILAKYGPSIALAGLGAGALGFFDAPEESEPEFLTGADLLEQDPDKYRLPDEQITYVPDYNPFVPQRPVFTAAEGGVVGGLNRLGEMSDQMVDQLNDVVYGGGQGMGGGVGSLMQTPPGSLPKAFPSFGPNVRVPLPAGVPTTIASGFQGRPALQEMPGYRGPPTVGGNMSPQNQMTNDFGGQQMTGHMADYRRAQEDARRQREGGFMGRVMLPGERSFEDFMNMRPQFDLQQTSFLGAPFIRSPMGFEDGGDVFPRRTGGIMPDEGIAGEDSVRAMLMPGEFVMTTDAVKGLGNGDNDQGIRKMYDMMRGLEAKGRAMA